MAPWCRGLSHNQCSFLECLALQHGSGLAGLAPCHQGAAGLLRSPALWHSLSADGGRAVPAHCAPALAAVL